MNKGNRITMFSLLLLSLATIYTFDGPIFPPTRDDLIDHTNNLRAESGNGRSLPYSDTGRIYHKSIAMRFINTTGGTQFTTKERPGRTFRGELAKTSDGIYFMNLKTSRRLKMGDTLFIQNFLRHGSQPCILPDKVQSSLKNNKHVKLKIVFRDPKFSDKGLYKLYFYRTDKVDKIFDILLDKTDEPTADQREGQNVQKQFQNIMNEIAGLKKMVNQLINKMNK